MHKINRLNPEAKYRSDEYYKQLYGKQALITRLGYITIIHLDRPSKKEIQKRKEEIMREEIAGETFSDNCALCREFDKHAFDIVYYMQD